MLQGKKYGFRVDVSRKIKEKPVLKWMFPIKKPALEWMFHLKETVLRRWQKKYFFESVGSVF